MVESERLAGRSAAIEDRPNLLASSVAILWSFRLRGPRPEGSGTVDHRPYAALLDITRRSGLSALAERRDDLQAYLTQLAAFDPDDLDRDEALAYWLNLYNAGAQQLALDAFDRGLATVLRVGRAFERPFIKVAGERMSLHDVENGKIRRFGDPRIHAALNCASRSCPPLPPEPFVGADLDDRLDDRMRRFLRGGGLVADREAGRVTLSKVFEWFGSDVVRPERMPLVLPASPDAVLGALDRWIDDDTRRWLQATDPTVSFQRYDWRLGSEVH
jgi:hypothetical protein